MHDTKIFNSFKELIQFENLFKNKTVEVYEVRAGKEICFISKIHNFDLLEASHLRYFEKFILKIV